MSLSEAFLDEVRARTSLSGLIERKVKLVKAGREKKGCCPFHGEKTPSFYVNDDKGFYHCFGCSAHGDAIRWMTDHEGLPFIDAVKELAAAAGLEMPARDARQSDRDREQQAMFEIMARAAAWFSANLADNSGAPLHDFIRRRGLEHLVDSFDIGWAPGGRAAEPLHRHLKDVAPQRLVELGLARIHEEGDRKGEVFDFFRGRVMFPIRDQRGRVIGFGGRVLGDQQPKYLNSPDTPIFDKGRTLFNINRAGPAARAAGRLLVVEGYMDVIGLAGAGVDESVAPNGTALTENQISRLWRLSDTPILCFDGDKAGRAAAARAAVRALPMLEPGKSLSFVTPPDGQDPDDVARGGGREAVDAMLAKSLPLVEVLWRHERDAQPVDTPEQVAGLKQRLRDHVRSIRNKDVRDAYGQDIAKRFRQTFDAVSEGTAAAPRRAPLQQPTRMGRSAAMWRERPQSQASKSIARTGIALNVERAVIAGLLRHPDVAKREMEAISAATFTHPATIALRDLIVDLVLAGRAVDIPERLDRDVDFARKGPLRFSFTTDGADPAQAARDLADAVYQLRQ